MGIEHAIIVSCFIPLPEWFFRLLQRALIRQNSVKIGTFAEEVVLPKHRRSMHRAINTYGVLALRDVESDGAYMETTTEKKPIELQPKYFPVFMISISAIQVKTKNYFYQLEIWMSFCAFSF